MAVRAIDVAWRGRGAPRGAGRSRDGIRWRWTRRAAARTALALLAVATVVLGLRGVVTARSERISGSAAVIVTAPAPAAATRIATVRVVPGDTLWGIAMRHAPAGADPRAWIFRTAELNGLRDAAIVPGQILRLPAGSR